MNKQQEKLFKTALKSAENGALEEVSYWLQNYENGLRGLPETVESILEALGLIETNPIEEYEEQANEFIKHEIDKLGK